QAKVDAVVNASLDITESEILALVGESGCGKTTLGRTLVGLLKPTSGTVMFKGKDIWRMNRDEFQEYRRNVQIVHQDSYAALNPVRTVFHTLSAPFRHYHLAKNHNEAREKAAELLQFMGLTPPEIFLDKYPHQLSGGQRQRVVLARAVALRPKLIVADEPVSMIDVSLRLAVLELMHSLNERFHIAFLYITHDLATARYFAREGRMAVMYLGQIVETGKIGDLVEKPRHPYLQALLSAVPVPDPRKAREKKPLPLRSLDFPDPTKPPSGCRFHPRCPYAEDICAQGIPPLREIGNGRQVACHLAERIPVWHLV
ncbi:MAG TPA: ABC transporter ATP-binding protein, partial [Anaerolineae bacterium]|nr:ABC transporter ATP-binding protein [Anaerolineae bacterium]